MNINDEDYPEYLRYLIDEHVYHHPECGPTCQTRNSLLTRLILSQTKSESPFHLLENGKKSCIKCNTSTSNCGCPDVVSQQDLFVDRTVVELSKSDLDCQFLETIKKPGRYLRIYSATRLPNCIQVQAVYEPLDEILDNS